MTKNKKLQDFHHVRNEEQLKKMKEIQAKGICHFCPKYLVEYHDNPIEKMGKYWAVTKNDYPYSGTSLHYLLIHRRHVEHVTDISAQALTELSSHLKWLSKKYKLPAGGFFMRFGDTRYTGATATHLHAHLILGAPRNKNKKQKFINVAIGYEI